MSEIKVTAETISNQGKRHAITLEPLHEKVLSISAREVESTIPCGLQMDWGNGSYGDREFQMAVGAGVGSRWMTFHVGDRSYCINGDDIAKAIGEFDAELYPPKRRKRRAR